MKLMRLKEIWIKVQNLKKGLQNQNIFPSRLQEFPIPEISLKEQENIVNKIKIETDKQRVIEKNIQLKSNEISRIIMKAITN